MVYSSIVTDTLGEIRTGVLAGNISMAKKVTRAELKNLKAEGDTHSLNLVNEMINSQDKDEMASLLEKAIKHRAAQGIL
jgi:hypothetical protein